MKYTEKGQIFYKIIRIAATKWNQILLIIKKKKIAEEVSPLISENNKDHK